MKVLVFGDDHQVVCRSELPDPIVISVTETSGSDVQ